MLLRNFLYCSNEVKCSLFKSICTNMYCCLLWFNSKSSSVEKNKKVVTTVFYVVYYVNACLIVQVQCL